MDGQTVTSLVSALALLATAVFGGVASLLRTNPANVESLQQQASSADARATRADERATRAELRSTHAEEKADRVEELLQRVESELFTVRRAYQQLKRVAESEGWNFQDEVTRS